MTKDYFKEKEDREAADLLAVASAEKEDAQERIDFKKTLQSPEGVRVLYGILVFSGVWLSTMKASSEIYMRAGAASVGFDLLEKIQKIDPEGYLRIMKLKFDLEKSV